MKTWFFTVLFIPFALLQGCIFTNGHSPVHKLVLAEPDSGEIYHGIYPAIDDKEKSEQKEIIKEYVKLSGKEPVWICFSDNWFTGIEFPKRTAEIINRLGYIPFLRILPWSDYNIGRADTVYNLQKIIEGKFDRDLIQYAKDVTDFGEPIIITFGVEMNGNWFPWSGYFNGGNKNGTDKFKQAYRHIINIFREHGALNVTWAFHPNYNSQPDEVWNSMAAYYPGDDYIDWIGISVYGAQKQSGSWRRFDEEMEDAYPELEKISSIKPLAIFEFGVIENTEKFEKAEWIKGAFSSITSGKYPRIKAINWWHSNFENEDGKISMMRIDSSPETLAEYRKWIGRKEFVSTPQFK